MFSADFRPESGNKRVAKRQHISMDAEISAGRRTLCKLIDISCSGLRLQTYSRLEVGTQISISLPVAGRVLATVRWADDFRAGCEFGRPLDADVLSDLLQHTGQTP
ncbi:MAG: PilZ domain-containing protein [Oxalobacteraceae bacterium]|nr:MAG: PilZ domain-containing protein [Oxalobacteraceae bacterium]